MEFCGKANSGGHSSEIFLYGTHGDSTGASFCVICAYQSAISELSPLRQSKNLCIASRITHHTSPPEGRPRPSRRLPLAPRIPQFLQRVGTKQSFAWCVVWKATLKPMIIAVASLDTQVRRCIRLIWIPFALGSLLTLTQVASSNCCAFNIILSQVGHVVRNDLCRQHAGDHGQGWAIAEVALPSWWLTATPTRWTERTNFVQ